MKLTNNTKSLIDIGRFYSALYLVGKMTQTWHSCSTTSVAITYYFVVTCNCMLLVIVFLQKIK